MLRRRKTKPQRLLPLLLSTPLSPSLVSSSGYSRRGGMPVVSAMNPIERLATLFWDWSGRRRLQQRVRMARNDRKLREYDAVNEAAMAQVRRTQALSAELERHH